MAKTTVVIGATGDVGSGIVAALLQRGGRVIAIGRDAERLAAWRTEMPADADLILVAGRVDTDAGAEHAAAGVREIGVPDTVIVTVNGPIATAAVADLTSEGLARVLADNLLLHHAAARAFLPLLPPGGVLLGIGGGMADVVHPGMAATSMSQAAQRVLYRYLAGAPEAEGRHVRELMLCSMIAGKRTAAVAEPHWITADEVGRHVGAVLGDLDGFAGPILMLKSRKQVGLPERRPT